MVFKAGAFDGGVWGMGDRFEVDLELVVRVETEMGCVYWILIYIDGVENIGKGGPCVFRFLVLFIDYQIQLVRLSFVDCPFAGPFFSYVFGSL